VDDCLATKALQKQQKQRSVTKVLLDVAKAFYQRWNFKEIPGHPYPLFLRTDELEAMMQKNDSFLAQKQIEAPVAAITLVAGAYGTTHSCFSAISNARNNPRALFNVSSYSLAGMLSATMPAPACKYAVWPFSTSVRRAMHVSMLPLKST